MSSSGSRPAATPSCRQESQNRLLVPWTRSLIVLLVQHPSAFRSSNDPHQIDNREYHHPDDIKRVPEQGEAQHAALHDRTETPHRELNHHENQPDQPNRHVQSVTTDQRKEGGEKSAALRSCSHRNHAVEFVKLEAEKCRSQDQRACCAQDGAKITMRVGGQGHQPTGVAGKQEESGLHRCVLLTEQLSACWTARGCLAKHSVARKQG